MYIVVISVIAGLGVTVLFLICTVISLRTVRTQNESDRGHAAEQLEDVAERVLEPVEV